MTHSSFLNFCNAFKEFWKILKKILENLLTFLVNFLFWNLNKIYSNFKKKKMKITGNIFSKN